MDPLKAKKLLENPDFQDFIAFLRSEADQLNTLTNLPGNDLLGQENVWKISLEVKARQRAYERLTTILSPFLDVQNRESFGTTNKDFVV